MLRMERRAVNAVTARRPTGQSAYSSLSSMMSYV